MIERTDISISRIGVKLTDTLYMNRLKLGVVPTPLSLSSPIARFWWMHLVIVKARKRLGPTGGRVLL